MWRCPPASGTPFITRPRAQKKPRGPTEESRPKQNLLVYPRTPPHRQVDAILPAASSTLERASELIDAKFAECLSPKPDDAVFEGAKRPVVEDDPVVLTVSSQYLTEPLMLFPYGSVHPSRHFLTEDFQFPDHALRLRLPFDHEPAAPGLAAIVREAQEVEGLRASQPGGLSPLGGEPPERDQSGLARVEGQTEVRQPVLER